MPKHLNNFMKRLMIDVGGILLLLLALLIGWLPGPAGIPLTIAGLSLLAINHTWAKRLLERVKTDGFKIMNKIFSDNLALKWGLDILSVVLLIGAIYIFTHHDKRLLISVAAAFSVMALFLFLGNRKRIERLLRFTKIKP